MMTQALRPDLVPAVQQVMAQFAALELHAARAGREMMGALAETVQQSTAPNAPALAEEIRGAVDAILTVMPPYAPPLNVMHRVLARVEAGLAADETLPALRADIANDAAAFTKWSAQAREQIAAYGAELIPDGATVFTFTLSETALHTLRQAAAQGKQFRVIVTESRPNQDGLHTARELSAAGVEVSVSIDACSGLLMRQADLMMVGAEAVMADGSAIAKVGTYPTALAARQFGVPVYVIVDTLKLNVSSAIGLSLELDPIARGDVLPPHAPAEVMVTGALFDSTPAHLVRGIVTERGVISPAACSALMRDMPISQYLSQKLLNKGIRMSEHPAIKTVVERIHADAIGGAADIAKEVVGALAQLSADSSATDSDAFVADIMDAVRDILSVTPSFAPPINAMHRILGRMETANKSGASVAELKAEIKGGSDDFFAWAEDALDRVAQYGAERIGDGDTVFMYSMSSTVWRIFKKAKAAGKSFEVIVTESRPGNEGLWTVNEMHKNGIPITVSIDANIGELVPRSDAVFVGADAISSDGVSFVKVGTYPTALVAKAHGVPFYVAADSLKFDASTLLGLPFRGEPIPRGDVLSDDFPSEVAVVGDLFEPVPPDLVTALITEMGLLSPAAVVSVMWQMKLSDRLNELIPAWARGELRSHT